MRVRWLKWNTVLKNEWGGCRTPCECVDWNTCVHDTVRHCVTVALHASALIEIGIPTDKATELNVALHASALIEIMCLTRACLHNCARRTPCECVDWNYVRGYVWGRQYKSHSMRVRWLKFSKKQTEWLEKARRTPCECVDWNILFYVVPCMLIPVALHASALIEIILIAPLKVWA